MVAAFGRMEGRASEGSSAVLGEREREQTGVSQNDHYDDVWALIGNSREGTTQAPIQYLRDIVGCHA